ncbi:MAG: SUMF1/EgtB/PvdO family nonheme iron enzyme [Prevotellaceae bacterium]|jgi:formylglycine-generating enzyme required for sulfatase activity|nr:SUMF1/EgtB/PvdO family nonheme iron enzyme [Prevotellaceae bacterium]
MRKIFLKTGAMALALCAAVTTSCEDEKNESKSPPIAVTGVSLDKTTLTLAAGARETLTATVAPADATNKAVAWTSSDNAVAAVAAGVVTAVGTGSATITATTADGGKTAVCAVTIDIIDMVFVEGGSFTMGCTGEQGGDCYDSESPAHQVTLSGFSIGKYEVTQAQWVAVMGSNPSLHKADNYPVEYVSWNDVQAFITALNTQTGKQYRLPTEAEWEYAARGGAQSKGYKYSGSNNADDVAWFWDNTGGAFVHPVGTKAPNELGIYDMSGNVCEWCSDWFGDYPSEPQTNPTGPSSGSYPILRGGGYNSFARSVRVPDRNYTTPVGAGSDYGFRLARSSN